MLWSKLRRFALKNGFSYVAWRELFRRLIVAGPSEAANSALYDVATTIKDPNYHAWINQFEKRTEADVAAIKDRIEAMPHRPKLSIVMPTYNTPIKWLKRAIESVEEQLYPDWEFCIADDCSPDPEVAEVLKKAAARNPKIKFVVRETNGHISRASNSALELATGEFIVLLDHDDELPDHALYMVAEEINRYPDADIIYSDEDKIDEQGQRSSPYFKCQYNPDLFLGQNMISHLGVYRTELIRKIGGFRPEFDGSQDYDLALRAIDNSSPEKVRHIPHVLYHWRMIKGLWHSVATKRTTRMSKPARRSISSGSDRQDRCGWRRPSITTCGSPIRCRTRAVGRRHHSDQERRRAAEGHGHKLPRANGYPNLEILIVDNQSDDPAPSVPEGSRREAERARHSL